ncbi:hypothetical protein VTN00DRAFT_867 [Thermoascus crustaceus]|uniref:uncharacterized protein n=1 Tax=Thermoascus crustaceus TaxID=5088 RepID=UPI0037439727
MPPKPGLSDKAVLIGKSMREIEGRGDDRGNMATLGMICRGQASMWSPRGPGGKLACAWLLFDGSEEYLLESSTRLLP